VIAWVLISTIVLLSGSSYSIDSTVSTSLCHLFLELSILSCFGNSSSIFVHAFHLSNTVLILSDLVFRFAEVWLEPAIWSLTFPLNFISGSISFLVDCWLVIKINVGITSLDRVLVVSVLEKSSICPSVSLWVICELLWGFLLNLLLDLLNLGYFALWVVWMEKNIDYAGVLSLSLIDLWSPSIWECLCLWIDSWMERGMLWSSLVFVIMLHFLQLESIDPQKIEMLLDCWLVSLS